MHRLLFAWAGVVWLASSACGGFVELFETVPEVYIPGESVVFDMPLPPMQDLGFYNIDLVLEGSTGIAGVDYYFDMGATVPATTSYVFPTPVNYFAAVNIDSLTRQRLTLTDFDLTGVHVLENVNDQVARVVLATRSSFTGMLSLSIDESLLILNTPTLTPVAEFAVLQSQIADAFPITIHRIPEPSSWVLWIVGCALFRRWRNDG